MRVKKWVNQALDMCPALLGQLTFEIWRLPAHADITVADNACEADCPNRIDARDLMEGKCVGRIR